MNILNFGSLNLDFTYNVPHIVIPGETLTSTELKISPGGKGLNQSVALAKAGANVFHAGLIGNDGLLLKQFCEQNGVNTNYIEVSNTRSGNAIIQVDDNGQNSIVLFSGANHCISKKFIDNVIENFNKNDYILLQNEINNLDYIINKAWNLGLRIILNPSPASNNLKRCSLEKIFMFILNEIEGKQLTGKDDTNSIIHTLKSLYPNSKIVLTLGEKGSIYFDEHDLISQSPFPTLVKDTTGAGDTFTGYFINEFIKTSNPQHSLRIASIASSIAISRIGAATSIPIYEEVTNKLK